MTKNQFKEAFKRGLGRALIELQRTDNPDKYKEIILWGCLSNTCYDTQCEGGRADYLYTAIQVFGDTSYFENEVIRKFWGKTVDMWLFDQLGDLLYLFAKDGSKEARDALNSKYDALFRFLSNKKSFNPVCSERDAFEAIAVLLTSLDGFSRFKEIVRQVGEFYERAGKYQAFSMEWFYTNAQNKFGKKRVITFMENEAKSFQSVSAFLENVREYGNKIHTQVEAITVEDLIKACNDKSSWHIRLYGTFLCLLEAYYTFFQYIFIYD